MKPNGNWDFWDLLPLALVYLACALILGWGLVKGFIFVVGKL